MIFPLDSRRGGIAAVACFMLVWYHMDGRAFWDRTKATKLKKLISKAERQFSTSVSATLPVWPRMPWLRTNPSRRPNDLMAASTAFWAREKSERSPCTISTWPLYSSLSFFRGSRLRASTTTLWDCGADSKYFAMESPRPGNCEKRLGR